MSNWENSTSGIKKHYRKILYPTLGVALAGTTTAAVALPIMIKKIATERATNILEKILPLGGPTNSLADRLNDPESKGHHQGRLNYFAMGDSITAGYNGFMNSNSAIYPKPTKPAPLAATATAAEITAYNAAMAKYEVDLKDYEAHVDHDYLSYADFIANDLKKADLLNDYRNFSETGDFIPNAREKIFRNTSSLSALQNADLVSISIGANDLLAAVEVLKLAFNGVRGAIDTDKVVQLNAARDAINGITKADINGDPAINEIPGPDDSQSFTDGSASRYPNKEYTKKLIKESFDKLVLMLDRGDLGGLIDIQQKLLNNIFDLIKLDLATLITEVHKASPKAKVVVMGYGFPFHLLPKTLTESYIPDYDVKPNEEGYGQLKTIDGNPTTLKGVFNELIATIKSTVERANYVKFFDINSLKEFSDQSEDITYQMPQDKDGNVIIDNSTKVTRKEWDRVMPNPLDIHPSTYGHQVIAGHLFDWMLDDMQKQHLPYQSLERVNEPTIKDELEKIYTYAQPLKHNLTAPVDQWDQFEIRDEFQNYDPVAMRFIINSLDSVPMLNNIGAILKQLISAEKLAQNYETVMDIYNDETISSFDKITKIVDLLPSLVKESPFGNVPGFTTVQFVTKLAAIFHSCDFSHIPEGQGISGIIPNLATPAFKIHGIQAVEMILGSLIYLAAEPGNIGTIDRSIDTNAKAYRDVIIMALNSQVTKSTPSMASLLVFGMFSPALDGGAFLQDGTTDVTSDFPKFIDEIFEMAKSLGMNIDSVKPTSDVETWLGNVFLGDVPLLTKALQALGAK